MRLRRPRPWVFAVVGSVIILGSTFIGGWFVQEKEVLIERANVRKRQVENRLRWTEAYTEKGDMAAAFADAKKVMYSSILKLEVSSDPTYARILSADLGHAAFCYAAAAEHDPGDEVMAQINALEAKVNKGDQQALVDLYYLLGGLVGEAADFHKSLLQQVSDIEEETGQHKTALSRLRAVSIALQIVGLVVLLFKEAPSEQRA
jgi:hypothetical protein